MPRFRDADGRNDVTLFKILLDPPLSNEVARGEKKNERERKKEEEEKGKGRERWGERREREKGEVVALIVTTWRFATSSTKVRKKLSNRHVNQRRCYCFPLFPLADAFVKFQSFYSPDDYGETLKIFPSCSFERLARNNEKKIPSWSRIFCTWD